jgi:pentapeptide MXKDX repeat protein
MKKLMTLMLGLSLAFTTVAVTFAQDAPKKEEKKKDGKKKGGKKKEDAPKKDGR